MRIGVLTSSRADFGIYEPLINKLILEKEFNLEIIAFGSHLSKLHGFTLKDIIEKYQKKCKIHQISSLLVNDDEISVATAYGLTALKFSEFWNVNKYDLVFCLGDRFEMSAAVQASIPFGVKLAHIHGGETTLGAIDNIYRHQITLASTLHFTSTENYKKRVSNILHTNHNIHCVGALSLSELKLFKPVDKKTLLEKYNIKMQPFCLITFHPETNAFETNNKYALAMEESLEIISQRINLVITMPNADTMGTIFRDKLHSLKDKRKETVFLIENFGKRNYFSAMQHAEFLIGNTSSGIIEAASFQKYVVNVGDRQKGRAKSNNVIDAKFNKQDIINAAYKCILSKEFIGENVYFQQNSAKNIIKIIKNYEKL